MISLDDAKLISLKEAAQLCGYSSDYIGQLIRAGKIPGKQVYSNVQWMTTAEAVVNYKNKSKTEKGDSFGDRMVQKQRKLAMEINVLRLFFSTFRSALPLLGLIIGIFIILVSYLLFAIFAAKTDSPVIEIEKQKVEDLSY